jgi:hypothetical protein
VSLAASVAPRHGTLDDGIKSNSIEVRIIDGR